jgi:hypothetical protein
LKIHNKLSNISHKKIKSKEYAAVDQSILGKIIQAFDLLIPKFSLYSLRKFQHLGHMSADHKQTNMERENHSSDISIKI